jgi:hypothetical protein
MVIYSACFDIPRDDLFLLTTDQDFQTVVGLPQENWMSE